MLVWEQYSCKSSLAGKQEQSYLPKDVENAGNYQLAGIFLQVYIFLDEEAQTRLPYISSTIVKFNLHTYHLHHQQMVVQYSTIQSNDFHVA